MSDRTHGPPPAFAGPFISRLELDQIADEKRCTCAECKGKYSCVAITPKCCPPGKGLDVVYSSAYNGGVLEIRCNGCGRPICAVGVS